ncbi:MAG: ABC transporter substrate-binding protein [Candidatus Eremiobacteraeota bacterium]|nr:ABC transporter substrate-binding protein [Candidatus Eremiobacteraeota bacterium]MBV8223158.1 ABC transporter substrate-binding protein [Candidatus Eremiobacteraeota bacterium]MBV8280963.1 ABC transporter substrate-binding protein [Candidatus Eremiobacteraeota bacterium]
MSPRALLRLAACAVLVLACAACAGERARSDRTTLIFGRNKDAITLDPALAFDGISLTTSRAIFEGLTRYKAGTFEVEPALATSWSMSADGRSWTFRLRHGVRFQDGTLLDADAVKFNFDRWRDAHNPYHAWGYFTYYLGQFGGFPGLINGVDAVAPDTVRIRLQEPLAPLLADLAMPAFGIASPAALRRERERFAQAPVGTGPYKLVEWAHDDHITLERFDGYWGAAPRIERVILRDIPDAATTILLLQRGDIDGWEFPTPDGLTQLAHDPRLRIYHQPANSVMFLAFNTRRHPFDDVRVRRALSLAIDRTSLVRHFFDPTAQVAVEFLPEAVWPHGVPMDDRYDPTAAKRLLAQAGFPRGFATTLWFMTAPRPYLPEPQRVAEAIQADLAAVGVNARLQGLEWAVFIQKVQDAQHDMCVIGWTGDNGDPDNFTYMPLDRDNAVPPAASNVTFWSDERFHALVTQARHVDDVPRRQALYRQALEIASDQAPLAAIAHTTPPIVFRADLRGYVPSPDSSIYYQDLSFAER